MRRLAVGMGVGLLIAAQAFAQYDKVGVLILAHGGSPIWNAQVERAVQEADISYPTEVAFGMGMMEGEVRNIQTAIARLESRGAQKIIVLPLLISSHSSVYRQYQYLLGMRDFSSWPDHPVAPVKKRARVILLSALDDSELVAEILAERISVLSEDSSREAVVLVAHGPEEEKDDRLWLRAMSRLGQKLEEKGRFAAMAYATLQDDAPLVVRDEATRRLRQQVSDLGEPYRVLVVPLLLSQNGIEQKIGERLEGLAYVYTGATLLPHPNITRWIRQQVDSAVSREE